MEPVDNIARTSISTIRAGSTQSEPNRQRNGSSTGRASAGLVNDLFIRMTAICTGWRQAALTDANQWAGAYKSELLTGLLDSGVNGSDQIETGLQWLRERASDWLPNPGAFAMACVSAPVTGLPSEQHAYRLAVDWSRLPANDRHPAVLAALCGLDTWSWRRLPDADARKQFSVAWKAVVERVRADGMDWLPDVPAGIEHDPAGVPVEREHARDRLAEIMGVLTE